MLKKTRNPPKYSPNPYTTQPYKREVVVNGKVLKLKYVNGKVVIVKKKTDCLTK